MTTVPSLTPCNKLDRPVRLVKIHVEESPPRGLKYPVKKVSSKKRFRRPVGQAYTMRVATDRLDLPADVIARIYQHRWKVELFFRLLKSVLGCRHLLSDSIEGVSVQVYCALIASLLLAEYTGLKPSKRTYELLALYLQGWVEDDELVRELDKLKKAADSKNSRIGRRVNMARRAKRPEVCPHIPTMALFPPAKATDKTPPRLEHTTNIC